MRWWMLLLVVWALPVGAAETFKVPFTVVPGSVRFQPQGTSGPLGDPVSVSLPLSEQAVAATVGGNCETGLVTIDASLVNDGLEIGINGSAVGNNCVLGGDVVFDVEVQVPELGGTTTVVRLVPEAQSFDFIDYYNVQASFDLSDSVLTSSLPGLNFAIDHSAALDWDRDIEPAPTVPRYQPVRATNWIPGDTMRFTARASISMAGTAAHTAQGNARVRFEYRVTVPEPSASLSLPLGMACLAGLSVMRGGA